MKIKFNSHKNHNPECDILEGHLDKDSLITYCINIKGPNKGEESMEYYMGSNYNAASDKKSFSKHYTIDKIPSKYKSAWTELKNKYEYSW